MYVFKRRMTIFIGAKTFPCSVFVILFLPRTERKPNTEGKSQSQSRLEWGILNSGNQPEMALYRTLPDLTFRHSRTDYWDRGTRLADNLSLFFIFLFLRLCWCLRRCVVCVNRDDASISTSASTRRLCLRRTGLHVGFLCFCLCFCSRLRRTCKPGFMKRVIASFSRVQNVYQASGITVEKKGALVMCRKGWTQRFESWSTKTQAWEEGGN